MYKSAARSLAAAALVALASAPAYSEARIEIGPLHIHIADKAPPRAHRERRPPRPGRDYVWLNGYHDRQSDQWVWVSGRWERPIAERARWIPARYAREDRVWRYEPAHWSTQQIIEGDDYRLWKEEHHSDRGRHRGHDRGDDRKDHDHDKGH